MMACMEFAWSTALGFFLGFAFGVGCALAVMYSIYRGGYRAAVKDAALAVPPQSLLDARRQAESAAHSETPPA
jgi:hypothetical protein